jgi:hypothetical protein
MEKKGLDKKIALALASGLALLYLLRRRKKRKAEKEERRAASSLKGRRGRKERGGERRKKWRWYNNPVVKFFILWGLERLVAQKKASLEKQLAGTRLASKLIKSASEGGQTLPAAGS